MTRSLSPVTIVSAHDRVARKNHRKRLWLLRLALGRGPQCHLLGAHQLSQRRHRFLNDVRFDVQVHRLAHKRFREIQLTKFLVCSVECQGDFVPSFCRVVFGGGLLDQGSQQLHEFWSCLSGQVRRDRVRLTGFVLFPGVGWCSSCQCLCTSDGHVTNYGVVSFDDISLLAHDILPHQSEGFLGFVRCAVECVCHRDETLFSKVTSNSTSSAGGLVKNSRSCVQQTSIRARETADGLSLVCDAPSAVEHLLGAWGDGANRGCK
mmetsp:Transcript_34391/g.92071  ORF Transcript_34391/g.92071 Transcript_34391/m.92071 type:complete len:263 (+) Transcript_34391:166-954(+)